MPRAIIFTERGTLYTAGNEQKNSSSTRDDGRTAGKLMTIEKQLTVGKIKTLMD